MESADTIGRRLGDHLDLDRKELTAVKELAARGDYLGVLDAYRDCLVERAALLDLGELPGFWLWHPTEAAELLEKGIVATAQYGEFDRVSRYRLGAPGDADWSVIPEDGYDVVLRDLPTMHWTGKLAEAYIGRRDPRLLAAFVGYWADFARNWLPAHKTLLAGNKQIEWDSHPHVKRSIRWASESKLYFAWRLDNLFSWLPAAIAVDPEAAKRTLDPVELATLVLHVVEFEIPGALRGLEAVGTPNQFVHCALGLLKSSLLLQDLREGPRWTETAIERMIWYADSGGYLADGSDLEQSFNYNPGLIHSLDSLLALAARNPPLAGRNHPWMDRFEQMRNYRERFLDSLYMPEGRRPATGCDNTWRYRPGDDAASDRIAPAAPTLGECVRSQLVGDRSLPVPAFTSIYFPYGGWLAMRDGWRPESLFAFMKTSRPAPGHMREGGNGLALAAYGRYLVVNSGADAYSDRGVFDRYFDSTVSQSSISVDGFSQVLNAAGPKPGYDRPITARWHSSQRFDFAEGIYESAFGGWSFRTGEVREPFIEGVRHVRQLLFVREAGVWVVVDRLSSSVSHDYTQSWCLGPDFGSKEVALDSGARSVATTNPAGANIELRFASSSPLELATHYGEKSEATALGFRALEWDEARRLYTPAVDLLAEWSGAGVQLVVTFIVPSPEREGRISEYREHSRGGAAGFEATLTDGTSLSCRASEGGKLDAAGVTVDGELLLVVTGAAGELRALALDADGAKGRELESDDSGAPRMSVQFGVPEGFHWSGGGAALAPVYRRASAL